MKYTSNTKKVSALPRSKRMREAGSGNSSVSTTMNITGGGSPVIDPNSHEHRNKISLDKITVEDGYLMTSEVNETEEGIEVKKVRARVGHADKAHDLDEESPVFGKFLSKEKDDKAKGHITFEKGITANDKSFFNNNVQIDGSTLLNGETTINGKTQSKGGIDIGNYVSAASGATIDKDGNAEFESIKGRGFLEVPEIRFNRATLVVGTDIQSPCGGVIKSVKKDGLYGGVAELELGDDEMFGSIQEGALCWGYFHDINDNRNNSDVDLDDRRGNITYRGFATVYFQIAKILDETHCTKFRYELRPGTTLHPYVGMNFGGRGNTNINEKSLQSFTIKTTSYEASYKLVTNWDWNEPEKHVVKVSGNLDGFEALAGKTSWPQSPFFGTIETNLLYRGNLEKVDNDTRFIYITQSSNGMLLTGETETVSFKVRDFAFQDRTDEFVFTINGVAIPKSEDPSIDIAFDDLTEDLTEFSVEATDEEYTLSSSFTERRLVFDYHLDVLKTAVDTSSSFDFGMEFNDGSSLDMNDGVPVVFVGNGDDIYAVRRIGKEDTTYGVLLVQMDDYLPTEINNREQVSVSSNVKSVTFIWYTDSSRSKEITRVKVPVINQQNSYVVYHDAVAEGERPQVPSVGQPIDEYGWYEGLKATSVWMSAKTASNISSGTWGEAIKIAGEDGNSVAIKGSVETESDLLLITAFDGDGYIVNSTGHLWVYYSGTDTWTDVGVVKGQDGKNAYVHIKYSPDGKVFSANNGEMPAAWIGTYADGNAADSSIFADYKWKKIEGASSFVSFVFKRSVNTPAAPAGGTFSSPVPSGWEDGIPASGVGAVWMSKRTFFSDDRDTAAWSAPKQMTDTADFDVCYHKGLFGEGEIEPAAPSKNVHPTQGENPDSWHDTALVDDVWMATSECHNGVWSDWQIFRIKGEKGDKGEDADTYELVVYKAALNPLGEMEFGMTFNSGDSIDLDNGKSLEAISDGDEVSAVRKFRYEETTQGNLYYQYDGNARVKINNHDVVTVKSGIRMVTFTWTNDADVEIARKDIPVVSNGVSITSFVFKLAPSKPAKPVLGSYSEPVPLSEGWTDGIPQGEGILWMSKRTFWNDGRTNGDWSEPKQMTDTETLDICYNNSETKPSNPLYHNTEDQGNGWHNTATDAAVWMAIARKKNDVWSEWEISKIKGEDGDEYKTIYAFIRSVNTPNTPTGGTFKDPIPVGWSESIPDGDASIPVWQSKRVFCSNADKGDFAWSRPNMMADTSDFDICYHDATADGKKPTALPTSHHTEDQGNGWTNTPTDKTVWVATAQLVSGTWQAWKISKFKGDQGDSFTKTTAYYFASTSNTAVPATTTGGETPGSAWKLTQAAADWDKTNKYLWTVDVETKTDHAGTKTYSTKTPHVCGMWAEDMNMVDTFIANNIAATDGRWEISARWTTEVVARSSWNKTNQYLWKRTYVKYTDGSDEYFYSATKLAKQIDYTETYYAISKNGKTAPSSGWVITRPEITDDYRTGEYFFWTRTITHFTEGDNNEVDTVLPIPVNGKSPYVKDGYWYIDGNNTGIKATPEDPDVWTIGADGYWYFNGAKTDSKAIGENGQSVFVSYVFRRSKTVITAAPVGGSYKEPKPTTSGWSDGVPTGSDPVYMSQRCFTSDGKSPQQPTWSTPCLMADTADIDICFSSRETQPAASTLPAKGSNVDNAYWHNKATEDDIWMAICSKVGGVWGDWQITKIKGEDGEDGKSAPRKLYYQAVSVTRPNVMYPSGWSKTPMPVYNHGLMGLQFNEMSSSSYDGRVVDTTWISNNQGVRSSTSGRRISFITQKDDTIVSFTYTISSEHYSSPVAGDKGYFGNVDSSVSTSNYRMIVDGEDSGVVEYVISKKGSHYIDVMYKKDTGTDVGSDRFTVSVPKPLPVWEITEILDETTGDFLGWSDPVKYLDAPASEFVESGLEGLVIRRRGSYDSGIAYVNQIGSTNSVKYVDVVEYNGSFFKRTAYEQGRYGHSPYEEAYWTQMEKLGDLYAEYIVSNVADITYISGSQMAMKDNDGFVTAGMRGGTGVQIWAGGLPNNARFSVTDEGTMVAQRGEFHGIIKAFDENGDLRSAINVDGTGTTTYYYPATYGGGVMQETVFEYDGDGNVNGMKTIYRKSDGSVAWVLDSKGISNTLSEYWTHFDRYELIVDDMGVVGGVGRKIACSRFVSTTANTAPYNGLTAQGTLTGDAPSSVSSSAKLHGWYHKTGNYKWIQDAHGAIGGKIYYSCERYERGLLIATINLEGA